MKSAKNVYKRNRRAYQQTDNKAPIIYDIKGAEILSSRQAWESCAWTKKYFSAKPKNGYFIWAKQDIDLPLSTCMSISAKKVHQKLENLLVVDKGLKIKIQGTCNTLKKELPGTHQARGKIILKENSILRYEHIHYWGAQNIVDTDYEFLLEKNAKLNYVYKNFSSPKEIKLKTLITLSENSSAEFNIIGQFSNTNVDIKDTMILKEKLCSGLVKLRLAGNKNSRISACSEVFANAAGIAHLDCQGILLDKDAEITLIPKIVCRDRKAQITHEASIGKLSEEAINYLRMRGLTENQAINLIVKGFLET